MLKINKILSKKIKPPLSLRGLFPFCHSRESGNPSSMSFRGEKQRSNLKGFSLIELMVAVVILAIAVLGIFLAFSNAWMGMANARDRTVATNYAQEILEDIKNTLFEKIDDEDSTQIGDTKFYRSIILYPIINPHIKEVTALVTWDNSKSVDASTLIYSQIASEPVSEAVALALYAEPYFNILPGSSSTKVTVLVQDANGNLVTDGEKDILFSVGDPLIGDVLPSSITTQNGKATVFFASTGVFGSVEVEASSPGLTSDSFTLMITDAAVAIKLEADPATISTGEHSVINVSLLDASYVNPPIPEKIDEHLVTLYVKEGPGTITPISVLLNIANGGTSSITLTTSGTPGVVTIVASSMDLESALVNVPILGSAKSISITAIPPSINLIENTEITVTIEDSAGNPVIYSGSINLSLSISNGSLSGDDYVDGVLTFLDKSSKTITYTPSDAGEVDIIATSDVEGELSSDTVTVYISEGRKIELTPVPDNIVADGNDSSTITATIKDINGETVTGEEYQIVFEILSGYGSLSDIIKTTENGVATTILTSTSELDVITVIARGMDLTPDSVTVLTTIPKFISISADKDWLYEGDEAVISINVVDGGGYPVEDYFGSINLILSDSGLGSIIPDTLSYHGEVIANFTASSTGEVTITADGEGINSDSITLQILKVGEAILTLADNITISPDGTIISFDISNDGIVGLQIVQMQVIWNSLSSTLAQVQARAPSASNPVVVYNGPAVGSGTLIDIVSTILPSVIPNNISTISLYFSGDMNGKTITVLFFDYNLQYGPLEFTVIP